MASFELKASGRSAAQRDDEWLFDQTGQAGASTGQAWPPAPAAGRWSSSLSERLEAAARAREQAQADAAAAAAAEAGAQQQAPVQPAPASLPEAPAMREVAAMPEAAATPRTQVQPDIPAMPQERGALGVEPTPPGADESPRSWALDRTGDPAEPVYRSVWEPMVRHSGVPGSAPDRPAGQGRPQPSAAPGTPVQPNNSSPTGISRQAGDGLSSQGPAGSAPAPSSSSAASGPAPLPRRQPQTHLAAPLRRQRPAGTPWQHADPSPSLPSVWDVHQAPAAERGPASPASDPLDDQA